MRSKPLIIHILFYIVLLCNILDAQQPADSNQVDSIDYGCGYMKYFLSSNQQDSILIDPYCPGPQPVEGMEAIQEELSYPQEARDNNIEGRVVVKCIILKTGEVAHIKIEISLGYGCDEEAMRIVRSIKWKPTEVSGKFFSCGIRVPVTFSLNRE